MISFLHLGSMQWVRLQHRGVFWSLPKRASCLRFLQLSFHSLSTLLLGAPRGQPDTYQASLLAPEWIQPKGDTEKRTQGR